VYNALVRILLTGRAVQRKPAATLTCLLVRASSAPGSLYPALVGYSVSLSLICVVITHGRDRAGRGPRGG
jgi:hypothetical protein